VFGDEDGHALFEGAIADSETTWPAGFDPHVAGVITVPRTDERGKGIVLACPGGLTAHLSPAVRVLPAGSLHWMDYGRALARVRRLPILLTRVGR
jgi:hypothetical protein